MNHTIRFASTPPFYWRGIPSLSTAFLLFCSFVLLLFCSSSCVRKPEIPVPKPKGYFRLTIPVAAYQKWDSVFPFTFNYSKSANLSFYKVENDIYWIDIQYPSLSAMFKMSFVPVKNNLHSLMWNEEEQVLFHVERRMTDDIQYSSISDPNAKMYGRLYELEGKNVATPFKFWFTDSTHYFMKGVLYFEFAPNNDSLAPVIDFLKKDALYMIESWKWK
ncbi:MAG: hypothetical protein LBI45_02690 [Bacteroidales bacterium]|nr:hypothetical protein [Bacteroidales bacterium]